METWLIILITLFSALGIREIFVFVFKWFFGRKRDSFEIENLGLTNADKKLKNIQDITILHEELVAKFQAQLHIITSLKEDKVLDKQKIDHRDGVIEYQKKELGNLHDEIIILRANESRSLERITELEARVSQLEKQNKELIGLKEINAKLLSQNMEAKAILKQQKDAGLWKGDEDSLFG